MRCQRVTEALGLTPWIPFGSAERWVHNHSRWMKSFGQTWSDWNSKLTVARGCGPQETGATLHICLQMTQIKNRLLLAPFNASTSDFLRKETYFIYATTPVNEITPFVALHHFQQICLPVRRLTAVAKIISL